MVPHHACSRCGKEKEEDAFPFFRRKSEGRQPVCKPCAAGVRSTAYYKRNVDKCTERAKAWATANRERSRGTRRAWREANAEKLHGQDRRRAKSKSPEQREHRRLASARYYAKNRLAVLEAQRARIAACPDKNRERARAWAEKNPERAAAHAASWRSNHPETLRTMRRIYRQTRRARTRSAGRPERARIEVLLRETSCSYCEKPFDLTVRALWLTVDHIISLAQGGTNASENLLAACYGCNRSKGARLLSEWKKNPRPGWTPPSRTG